jgi:hypothetical protein
MLTTKRRPPALHVAAPATAAPAPGSPNKPALLSPPPRGAHVAPSLTDVPAHVSVVAGNAGTGDANAHAAAAAAAAVAAAAAEASEVDGDDLSSAASSPGAASTPGSDEGGGAAAEAVDAAGWVRITYWPQGFVRLSNGALLRLPSHGRLLRIYAAPESTAGAPPASASAGWVLPVQVRPTVMWTPPPPPLPTTTTTTAAIANAAATAAASATSGSTPPPPAAAPLLPSLGGPGPLVRSPSLRASSIGGGSSRTSTPRSVAAVAAAAAAAGGGTGAIKSSPPNSTGYTPPKGRLRLRGSSIMAATALASTAATRFFTPATLDVLLSARQLAALVRLQARVRGRGTVRRMAGSLERRRQIWTEIVDTEVNYVGHLVILLRHYERGVRTRLLAAATPPPSSTTTSSGTGPGSGLAPASAGDLMAEQPPMDAAAADLVFGDVPALLACHEAVLRALKARTAHWGPLTGLAGAFAGIVPTLAACYEVRHTRPQAHRPTRIHTHTGMRAHTHTRAYRHTLMSIHPSTCVTVGSLQWMTNLQPCRCAAAAVVVLGVCGPLWSGDAGSAGGADVASGCVCGVGS